MKFVASQRRQEPPPAEDVLAVLNQPLPHSDEAEMGVLAALLLNPQLIGECRLVLLPDAFYRGDTRMVYVELLTMDEEAAPVDAAGVELTKRLREKGKLEIVGGPAGISAIVSSGGAFYKYHLKEVAARWKLRRAIHGYALGLHELQSHYREHGDELVESTINAASQVTQAFVESNTATTGTTATLSECLVEHMEHMQELQTRKDGGQATLLPTGFPTLDRHSGGIGMNEYWLVTGPTKSGKSVLTGCIARHATVKGFHSKVYTNEIDRKVYTGRLLVQSTDRLPGNIERLGFENRLQMDAYSQSVRELQQTIGKRMKLDNASGKFVEDIVADIRTEAQAGTHLFVVDLIGKLRTRDKFESRERELAHISLSLFEATKRYNVACIAVAQENDDGQVRESRSLAFDCEAWLKVCYVAKPTKAKKFGETAEPPGNMPDRRNLVIAVARGFASGDVIPCFFKGERFLIGELEPEHRR